MIAPINRAALGRGVALSVESLRAGELRQPLLTAKSLLGLLGLRSIAAAGRLADDVVAPGHRAVSVTSPWLVVAPPRSGTTLLFDLLAQDPRFSAMRMYESMFPAASLHRAFEAMARLDPRTGGAISSLLAEVNQRLLAPVDPVHRSRFEEHEEDVPIFMPALVDGSALSALPFYDKIPEMRFLDDLPASLQDEVMAFYKSSIQRFLHAAPGRTYLAKNVHSGGRLRALRRAFPDMRMIHIARHPYQVIPTAIQLAQTFWTRGNPGVVVRPDAPSFQAFGFGVMELYRRLLQAEREEPADRFCTVRFDDLVREPRRVVEHLYRRFDTPIDETFSRRLDTAVAARDRHKSARPFTLETVGISRETIHRELYDVFEAYGFSR
jgi:hypothetical protein